MDNLKEFLEEKIGNIDNLNMNDLFEEIYIEKEGSEFFLIIEEDNKNNKILIKKENSKEIAIFYYKIFDVVTNKKEEEQKIGKAANDKILKSSNSIKKGFLSSLLVIGLILANAVVAKDLWPLWLGLFTTSVTTTIVMGNKILQKHFEIDDEIEKYYEVRITLNTEKKVKETANALIEIVKREFEAKKEEKIIKCSNIKTVKYNLFKMYDIVILLSELLKQITNAEYEYCIIETNDKITHHYLIRKDLKSSLVDKIKEGEVPEEGALILKTVNSPKELNLNNPLINLEELMGNLTQAKNVGFISEYLEKLMEYRKVNELYNFNESQMSDFWEIVVKPILSSHQDSNNQNKSRIRSID